MGVVGVEVDVQETEYCVRRSWGDDIYAERIPSVPARHRHPEDTVDHPTPPSLGLLVEQRGAKVVVGEHRHGRELYALERRVVLSVGRQKAGAHSGIIEERLSGGGSDFLEMNNVGKLGSLQDV